MTIRDAIIDELLSGQHPPAVFAKDGLLDALKKAQAKRALNAELDHHLAGERAQAGPETPRNHRSGHNRKTVLSGTGKLENVRRARDDFVIASSPQYAEVDIPRTETAMVDGLRDHADANPARRAEAPHAIAGIPTWGRASAKSAPITLLRASAANYRRWRTFVLTHYPLISGALEFASL